MSKLATQIDKLLKQQAELNATLATIEAKLEELVPQYEAEQAEAKAREAIDVIGLPVGSSVSYVYGRAEKRRNLVGSVAAFSADTKVYRILHGAGFDAEFHTVSSKDVSPLTGA